jgi:hypothetical protein
MGRACSTNGETRNVYRILVGNPEGKRPLGRPRRRLVDNIQEIEWDGMDWIDLTQDRDQWRALVNTMVNLRLPYSAGNFLSCPTCGEPREYRIYIEKTLLGQA